MNQDPADITPADITDTPAPPARRELTPEQSIFERLYERGSAPSADNTGPSTHLHPGWYEAE